jgi:CrcB protein
LQYFAIAVGGAAGAILRFWVSGSVHVWLGRAFPWGTLVVNVIGSLLIGVLGVLLVERLDVSDELRFGVLVGLLGSFTTFSTFSIETLSLLEQGLIVRAVLNAGLSVIVCILAAWLGVTFGRQL